MLVAIPFYYHFKESFVEMLKYFVPHTVDSDDYLQDIVGDHLRHSDDSDSGGDDSNRLGSASLHPEEQRHHLWDHYAPLRFFHHHLRVHAHTVLQQGTESRRAGQSCLSEFCILHPIHLCSLF